MAAKKAKRMTKADFVRSLPVTTPAKEVVAKAKEAGIALTDMYVYNVRSTSKASAKKGNGRKPSSRTVAAVRGPHKVAAAVGSVEELLKAIAAEIGLGRAIAVLQGERDRVRAVLGN
jgi:hypothetical protein